jgi:hypothetical protein
MSQLLFFIYLFSQLIANCRNYRDIFVTGEHSGNDRMLEHLLGRLSQGYPDCLRIRRHSGKVSSIDLGKLPTSGLLDRNIFRLARYPPLDVRFRRESNMPVLALVSINLPLELTYSEQNMPDIRKETDGLGVAEVSSHKLRSVETQSSLELTARRTVEK